MRSPRDRRLTRQISEQSFIRHAMSTKWCRKMSSMMTKFWKGNRVAVSTGLVQALGANVIDYSTWYDCCGFGFRHIISEREFTRSFAIDRKIKVAVEEARADVMVGHDTGCITTLDKNQWIGKAVDKHYEMPILADCQLAAVLCGAHPYKIAQLHWHASAFEPLLEKLGIDWREAKFEFGSLSGRR